MELKEIKEYLRIEVEEVEEDNLLSSLLLASKSYIENATSLTDSLIKNNKTKELYNLCIKLLISNWYENRAIETTGPNFHKSSYSLDSMLLQLEAEYLKSKRGAGHESRETKQKD